MSGGVLLGLLLVQSQISTTRPAAATAVVDVEGKLFISRSYVWKARYSEAAAQHFLNLVVREARVPVVKAAVYTDKEDALVAGAEKGSTDISKAFWESKCARNRARAKAAIEIVRIGNRESIRAFDKKGVRELRLPGGLPLNININKTEFTFLSLGIETARPMFMSAPEPTIALFYRSAGAVNAAVVGELVARLNLPVGNFDVRVSVYPEFIQDQSYPFFNRFVPRFACRAHPASLLQTAWCKKETGKKIVCDSWR